MLKLALQALLLTLKSRQALVTENLTLHQQIEVGRSFLVETPPAFAEPGGRSLPRRTGRRQAPLPGTISVAQIEVGAGPADRVHLSFAGAELTVASPCQMGAKAIPAFLCGARRARSVGRPNEGHRPSLLAAP